MRRFLKLMRDNKATVAVEFALVSTFFLFPLFAGVTDCVEIISAKAELNTALQGLYYYAWTNQSTATTLADVQQVVTQINTGAVTQITMPATMTALTATGSKTSIANASETFACFTPAGATTSIGTASTGTCAKGQTTETLVNYQVNATVNLTFPFPGLSSPVTLNATGAVQIQ